MFVRSIIGETFFLKQNSNHFMLCSVVAILMVMQVAGCSMDSRLTEIELSESESIPQTNVAVSEYSEISLQSKTEETRITTELVIPTESIPPISDLSAFSVVDVSSLNESEIRDCFYSEEISDEVFMRMEGKSFNSDCTTKRSDLLYIRVLHTDFEGNTRVGEIVANKNIAQDFVDIFYDLYLAKYPIEKIVLIDEYDADDNLSMADNNTSCFNFRRVAGTNSLSKHALGLAIDINPLYNPWIYERDGVTIIDPPGAEPYVDRQVDCPYIIDHDDLCYQLFNQHGFKWGGDWSNSKDYQHFVKS